MPPVNCSGSSLNAQLRGFVDRVDRWVHGDENYFRVVDYKTGKKDFDYCDVFNGLGLQMLLYMFALEQNGSESLGDCSTPAGVQYFPARVPYLSADGQLTDEEAANLRKSTWKRAGLLLCDEGVLEAMESGGEAFRLPYKRRKDGTIVGDIANSDQINMLKTYVFRLLGKMVDDIASGKVEPNPYTRGSSHNACTFCPYGSICHKTTVENRRNYQTMSAGEFWEYVQQEVRGHG
jgi:ATP-dependent helicase/nuclease subunit B